MVQKYEPGERGGTSKVNEHPCFQEALRCVVHRTLPRRSEIHISNVLSAPSDSYGIPEMVIQDCSYAGSNVGYNDATDGRMADEGVSYASASEDRW